MDSEKLLSKEDVKKVQRLTAQMNNATKDEEIKRYITEITMIKERAWVRQFERQE